MAIQYFFPKFSYEKVFINTVYLQLNAFQQENIETIEESRVCWTSIHCLYSVIE